MIMKKRFLSVLLALVMVLSLLPAGAMATEASTEEADTAKAQELLAAFKTTAEPTWSQIYALVLRANGLVGEVKADTKTEILNYLATVETLELKGPKTYQSMSDLGVLAPFKNLKTLSVTDTMEDGKNLDIGALAGLTQLENVTLSRNNITNIGALASCPNLKTLDLSGNKGLTDFGALEYLTNLEELDISDTGANNETFGALQKLSLTSLNLSGSSVSDIGGLTYDPVGEAANKVKDSLLILDISNTAVSALDSGVWREDKPVFSTLKTLTARGLTLTSISGLANIAKQSGFTADGITWDLTDSRVQGSTGADQVAEIVEKFGESGSFIAPVKDLPSSSALTSAESWKTALETSLGDDGGKANLTWDALITSVYWYRQAQTYVSELGDDVSAEAKTEAQNRLTALTDYYSNRVTKLDMSGKKDSKYAISTGALTDFKALTDLNLSDTGIKETGGLKDLTNLTKLDLSKNTGINNTHLGALVGLENLTDLNLSGTSVSDIGGLASDSSKAASKLQTLDISDTPVTKLECVWNSSAKKPAFSALATLNAKNLNLTSISGLVEIASQDGFNSTGLVWNLDGGTLMGEHAAEHVAAITEALKDNNTFKAPEVPAPAAYTIKFASGGGSGEMADASYPKANSGDTTYTLPECTFTAPSEKVFSSWTVAGDGLSISGNTLTIASTVEAGTVITVTASYRDKTAAKYTITSATAANGSFTVSPASEAAAGDTVTVTATPDEGYMVDKITVSKADNTTVTVTNSSFVMPAEAVTITVTFKETGAPTSKISAKFTSTLTGTDIQEYYYGKLELTGLKAGSYYLVAFDNGNAKTDTGNSVYPRTCIVVEGTGSTISMTCQPNMYVSVYALHAGTSGAKYVIPEKFAEVDAFGLDTDNMGRKVETLTEFTVLRTYAEYQAAAGK